MPRNTKIRGISEITLRQKSATESTLVESEIRINIPPELDHRSYFHKNGEHTLVAAKTLTQCFVQGLVANIHYAHEKKYWDSADHLRYIVRELERGFTAIVKVKAGEPY